MKKVLVVFVLAVSALALVACGGGGSSSSTTPAGGTAKGGGNAVPAGGGGGGGGGSSTLQLSADSSGALSYNTKSLSAKAGNVTIDFNNPAAITHDVAVEDSSGKQLGVSSQIASSKTTLNLSNLKPGTYTFFCSVDGHRQAGMEGTLTVK
jgi:plastocyanin